MKNIIYSQHLEFRLKLREIPRLLPQRIYQTSKEHYFDTQTGKNVAVKKVRYRNKSREMAVIYEETNDQVTLITIHPLTVLQKSHRIKVRRWQKI